VQPDLVRKIFLMLRDSLTKKLFPQEIFRDYFAKIFLQRIHFETDEAGKNFPGNTQYVSKSFSLFIFDDHLGW